MKMVMKTLQNVTIHSTLLLAAVGSSVALTSHVVAQDAVQWRVDGGGNTICDCPADLDGDGEVGGSDLAQLLANWGCSDEDCVADLDGNGTVNGADLAVILSAWGDCQD